MIYLVNKNNNKKYLFENDWTRSSDSCLCHDITSISLVSLHNKTSHHSRVTGHVTGHVSPRDIHQTDRSNNTYHKNFWQIRSFILNFLNNTIYKETECPSWIHGTALAVLSLNHSNLSFEFTMHVFIQVWKEENLFLDVVHRPLMASQVAEATL